VEIRSPPIGYPPVAARREKGGSGYHVVVGRTIHSLKGSGECYRHILSPFGDVVQDEFA
jgi:hypothetical protein